MPKAAEQPEVLGRVIPRIPRRGSSRISPALIRGMTGLVLFAIVWELSARYIVANPLFLAPLSDVLLRGESLWASGELPTNIWVSFQEFAWGFGLAAAVGIMVGICLAEWRTLRDYVDPMISLLYATPLIALGPLFILWMGIGLVSKVAIIFLTAVFPIVINTVSGLTTTDATLIEVSKSLGGTAAQTYTKVKLPSALPFIIAGLRLSVARALVGVVVAELFGARAGLGFMIANYAQSFDTPAVFLGVIILAAAGVTSVELLKLLERRMAPWRHEEQGR